MRKRVGIFLFDGAEALDVAGPFEVFSVADELRGFELFETVTFAEDLKEVRTVNGLRLLPHCDFVTVPTIDVLIIPGGEGVHKLLTNTGVKEMLHIMFERASFVLTICTGAILAADLGWLKDKHFCTHHSMYSRVKAIEPEAIGLPEVRFTGDGKLYSSAGVSAGLDLALYIVALVAGEETSRHTAAYIEYLPQQVSV